MQAHTASQTASTNALFQFKMFQCKSCFQIWFWTKSFTAKPNCANKSFVSDSKCLNVNVALKPNFNFWRTFLPWNQTMPTEALFWILCNPQKVRIKIQNYNVWTKSLKTSFAFNPGISLSWGYTCKWMFSDMSLGCCLGAAISWGYTSKYSRYINMIYTNECSTYIWNKNKMRRSLGQKVTTKLTDSRQLLFLKFLNNIL